jgi:HlyD family type I secretion membrane fusion protein
MSQELGVRQNHVTARSTSDPAVVLEETHTAAASSLQQRSRRLTLYGFSFVSLFFGGFAAWSALAPIESAIVANGQIIVEGNRKTVQHEAGGVIVDIRRRDGDKVEAGDILVRLDDVLASTNYEILLSRFRELKAMEARLHAERDGLDSISFPPEIADFADEPRVAKLMAGQSKIFMTRRETLSNQSGILQQQIERYREEISGLESAIGSQEEQVEILQGEITDLAGLLAQGLTPKARLNTLTRARAELQGLRAENLAGIARAAQAIEGANLQMVDLQSQRQDQIANQLREVEAQLGSIEEQMNAAKHTLDQTVVRAPQAGIVVGSRVHTIGGVVAAGAEMMQIVPIEGRLVVEAQIRPEDIEHVKTGLPAQVRLLGFNRRVTPLVDGTLTYVSADALTDPDTREAFYLTRIEVDLSATPQTELIELQPGMPAQVMVITGTRTLVDYIASPIMDGISNSMREQ